MIPKNVIDIFLTECLFYEGYPKGSVRFGLDALAMRYLGVKLDKSIRGVIHKEGLSDRVVEYSLEDVAYLELIHNKQMEIIGKSDLLEVCKLEWAYVKTLAYICYSGVKIDVDFWVNRVHKDEKMVEDILNELDVFFIEKYPNMAIESGDLFQPLACPVNWNAPQQVGKLLHDLGYPVTDNEGKISVEGKNLKKIKGDPLIDKYLLFKECQKRVSTYGMSWIKAINKHTGRVHSTFWQILDTGRLSSGNAKEGIPNLLNIPQSNDVRNGIVPEKGNVLIDSDYTGQENVILAEKSQEPNLLAFFSEGHGDLHSFVTQKVYPDTAGKIPLGEVKDKFPKERFLCKSVGFALSYGGDYHTVSRNAGISLEAAKEVETAYFNAFPGLTKYFNFRRKDVFDKGYILVNDYFKRKVRVPELEKAMQEYGNYDIIPSWKKGQIERNSLNSPTQGTAADMVKLAGIYVFDWIIESGNFDVVLMQNSIHDQIILEGPVEMEQEMTQNLKELMEKAGKVLCPNLGVAADPVSLYKWQK
jgi:DNA polymerase-1